MGVFVLRTSPINGFIKSLNSTDNLRAALEGIYKDQTYPDVQFFEWYQSDNADEVAQKLVELKSQYNIQ